MPRVFGTAWIPQVRHNNTDKRTKLMCAAWRAEGFHTNDLRAYTCTTCACFYGGKKFDVVELETFKQHRRGFVYGLLCNAAKEEQIRTLRRHMQQSRRRCLCHCRVHQAKNPLTPIYFGEKRWPGSDGAISAAERMFLEQLVPTLA